MEKSVISEDYILQELADIMVISQHNHAILCYEYAIKRPTISWVHIS